MNIILVVYDSLRKDCMGCYGPPPWWEVKTPNFDRLAQESLVMTHMYPEYIEGIQKIMDHFGLKDRADKILSEGE